MLFSFRTCTTKFRACTTKWQQKIKSSGFKFSFVLRTRSISRGLSSKQQTFNVNMGLETSVVCRFDTEPTFINTDGPTCHPPECHHNQGVNLSSVIFVVFSYDAELLQNTTINLDITASLITVGFMRTGSDVPSLSIMNLKMRK